MTIYKQGKDVFVPLDDNSLLCIGSEADVKGKNNKQIIEMVYEARMLSQYRAIENSKGLTLN